MVSQWFCVRPTSKRRFLKNSPSDHDTWPIRYRVGIHVVSTPTSRSHTPSVPRAECEVVKLDGLRRFHQWECLEWDGHGPLVSCVKWPLT